jgi:serine/threonine protein kinase/Tfp pilus assembly protein PilF
MKCPDCDTDNPARSRFCNNCGADLAAEKQSSFSDTRPLKKAGRRLAVGSTFAGRYRIIEDLGKGGMGLVYEAEDAKLKRHVALKLLPPDLTRDDEAKKRFVLEAQAASALDDPNVCTIYEIDETGDGQMFMSMACYDGETVKAKIERGAIPVEEAVEIAIQVAKGLARTHEAGIIHRDIKPGNILVTDRGEVRILDFGLAKLAGQTGLTKVGTTMGTVIYMSPEQARGEEVDHRTDIWSLGVVLYEMLAGRLPFRGDRDQTVIYSILNVDPKPLSLIRKNIPAELEVVVAGATAKNLRDRYGSMAEMLDDLKAVRDGIRHPDAPRPSGILAREQRTIAAARPIAVISFENQTGDKTYDYLRKAIPNLLITSLEHSRYLRVVTWERMGDLLKQMGRPDAEVIDKDLGFEICRMEDIDSIVLGSFTKAGDVFATDVKVLDVSSKKMIRSASSKGRGVDSILQSQIDELSTEISRGMGITESGIARNGVAIAEATTASMEAYDYFLRGRDAYEKLYNEDARRLLEKAVELDPAFAVAYLYLARVYGRLRENKARNETYEKAKNLSDRATGKERMYIEAAYAQSIERAPEEAVAILKRMAQEYPDEKRVHHFLAARYRSKKLFYQAVEEYNRVLELDPHYGWAMNELGYMYADAGDFDKAREYFERYASVSSGDANPIDSMGELSFRTGALDDAIAKYKEALAVKPDFYYAYWEIAYVSALKEDYREAVRWIDMYIAEPSSLGIEAEAVNWKCFYLYWQSDFEGALAEVQRLTEIAGEDSSEFWKTGADRLRGWIDYEMGRFKDSREFFERCIRAIKANPAEYAPPERSYSGWAQEQMASLIAGYTFALALIDLKEGDLDSARTRLNEIRPFLPSYSDLLHGELLLKEGSYGKAVTVVEKSAAWKIPYMSDTEGMLAYNLPRQKDVLARAYLEQGDVARAIEEYERLITVNRKDNDRRLIAPLYHYCLGKLYEAEGLSDRAAAQYRKYLDICRHAMPSLAEATDAAKRLARLAEGP